MIVPGTTIAINHIKRFQKIRSRGRPNTVVPIRPFAKALRKLKFTLRPVFVACTEATHEQTGDFAE